VEITENRERFLAIVKMNNIYQPEKRKPRLLDLVSQEIQTFVLLDDKYKGSN